MNASTEGLAVATDEAFQRRSWRVQRVGWVGMLLVLVAAAAGVLGSGPVSRTSTTVPGALRVEHGRFARVETPETLRVILDPAATAGDRVLLGLDRQYVDASRIEAVTPPPRAVRAAGDELIYEFAVARPGGPITIAFLLQHERFGRLRGRVVLHEAAGPATAAFSTLVYP